VTLERGERLEVRVEREGRPARIFIDLYRLGTDSLETPDHLESADSLAAALEYDARRDGDYVVRVQPELLRDVKYVVDMRIAPSLAFPVSERDDRAVRSFYGAERDGGRRAHQGIDIFAPRGTPVLAATDGFVRSAGTNRLGGNVVWLWDSRGRQSLYYAHLDTQLVRGGDRVRVGDTLGLVGNTGNARTTAPHLHFGIYVRGEGAVNPFPFVRRARGRLEPLVADTARLGGWVRSVPESLVVRPSTDTDRTAMRVDRNTTMRVLGASADAYRVRLPDGQVGYVAATRIAQADRPGRSEIRSQ
jgi:murein DD-endopeptidase MepM/ murein hydrolase activator NlpD